MSRKYFLKKISDYAIVGGIGAVLITSFSGCEDKSNNSNSQGSNAITNASQKQGAFVIVEKSTDGSYKIVDEFPSTNTTIVLRENGKERILSKEEIDALVAQEAAKIDNDTSNLTNSNAMGGLSLGETLLASAAGAIIGSYIGSKLFNNPNYDAQRRTSYKSPQTYSKSANGFNKPASTTPSSTPSSTTNSNKQSGYFGNSTPKSTTPSTSTNSKFGG